MSFTLRSSDLGALSIGSAVLGSGGGGDPALGRRMAEAVLKEAGTVEVVEADELPDDVWVLSASSMGSPAVLYEKIPDRGQGARAVEALAAHMGITPYAIFSAEAGGINGLIPIVVAAEMGLKLVDADGTGRAFPELHMETFHLHGLSGTPACLADETGDVVLLAKTRDNRTYERLARAVSSRFGGYAMVADYPMTGRDFKESALRGTLSLALGMGRAVLDAQVRGRDPVAALSRASHVNGYGRGKRLFSGKVAEVVRRSGEGSAHGVATLEGLGTDAGSVFRLDFKTEISVASRDGRISGTVPDILTVLEASTGLPIHTDRLRYGQRVAVVGIPVPEALKTPEALEVWGPRAFGYDTDYHRLGKVKA